MNLAILHYHLSPGGVTRVIENQLASLDVAITDGERWRVAILHGGEHDGFDETIAERLKRIDLSLYDLPAMNYDERRGEGQLEKELPAALARLEFEPKETILHVHNHALGKNASLPMCLTRLAADGYALLLQIHDFAEDLRPDNYRPLREAGLVDKLYPQADHIHYAVLNGRDAGILKNVGVPKQRLHWLPNPVPPIHGLPDRDDARAALADRFQVGPDERFVLYPVRCIRRKNLGEVLLHSALAPPGMVVGLTLPPQNPVEVPIFEGWKKLAAELELPCRFDVGAPDGLSFGENLVAADLIVTTSLAEGFGMVFLESWLAGRPLFGRDLPEITGDFAQSGIRLDWLHERLNVPMDWVGVHAFQRMMLDAYKRTLQAYGRDEPDDLPRMLRERTSGEALDFGDLDETLQQQVIRIVSRSEADRRRVLDLNPWIGEALKPRKNGAPEAIEHNIRVIAEHYGLEPSGRRLLDMYRRVAAGSRNGIPEPLAQSDRILDSFLDFARFRPIRS